MLDKEKLLVIGNFSFSHTVFKRPLLQTRKGRACLGKVNIFRPNYGVKIALYYAFTGK